MQSFPYSDANIYRSILEQKKRRSLIYILYYCEYLCASLKISKNIVWSTTRFARKGKIWIIQIFTSGKQNIYKTCLIFRIHTYDIYGYVEMNIFFSYLKGLFQLHSGFWPLFLIPWMIKLRIENLDYFSQNVRGLRWGLNSSS